MLGGHPPQKNPSCATRYHCYIYNTLLTPVYSSTLKKTQNKFGGLNIGRQCGIVSCAEDIIIILFYSRIIKFDTKELIENSTDIGDCE